MRCNNYATPNVHQEIQFMEQAILLHNPGSGEENHVKSELVESIEKEGFGCVYFSVKEDDNWKSQLDQVDFIVVAGGDGTVRTVVKQLVHRTALEKKLPIAILPMGTANNLSKTLGLNRHLAPKDHVKSWKSGRRQRFDIGVIKNADATDFFLESAGYGLFPRLMQTMDRVGPNIAETTEDKLRLALEVLLEMVRTTEAESYWIKADGQVHEGEYLLLEVMNTRSIGPNLVLAPEAKTDDGLFDIVCLKDNQRDAFARYIEQRLLGKDAAFEWTPIKAKELTIDPQSKHMHIDDELIVPLKAPLLSEVREEVLEFIVPKPR